MTVKGQLDHRFSSIKGSLIDMDIRVLGDPHDGAETERNPIDW